MSEPVASRLAREPDGSLESAEECASALAHDVGKYAVRVARNVAVGSPVPAALVPMLAKDLYETHRGVRASRRFQELARELPENVAGAPELDDVAAILVRIDALEPAVRAADADACQQAVVLARELDAKLSAFLRAIRDERAARQAASPACLPPVRGARG